MLDFISNILSINYPGTYEKEECIFSNQHFVVVKDIKMNNKRIEEFHYTAWSTNTKLKSYHDLKPQDYSRINEMKKHVIKYIENNCNCSDIDIFVHYPPQFWQLHIHFRKKDNNRKKKTYVKYV